MRFVSFSSLNLDNFQNARWMLLFTTEEYSHIPIADIRQKYPDLTIYGLHSFQGVCTPSGFVRGTFGLVEENDGIDMELHILDFSEKEGNPRTLVAELVKSMNIDVEKEFVFVHATSGNEERVLEGITDVCGKNVQLAGSTPAAPTHLGPSSLFLNEHYTQNGCIIGKFKDARRLLCKMKSGFLPTRFRGVVTKSEGRTVYTINNMPAVEIYNNWTERFYERSLKRGGIQPKYSSLQPFGRILKDTKDVYAISDLYFVDKTTQSMKFSPKFLK